MANYPDLKAKTVLITGGANGIGAAMVRKFDEQLARVFFCDLDTNSAARVANKCEGTVEFSRVDLAKEKAIRSWVGKIAKATGRIDVLINNAAADPRIPFSEMTSKQWDELFARNLRAYYLTAQSALPAMPRGAAVINFSSITFHLAPPQMTAYVATKGGILAFTRALARELGPQDIRVNTISPGWVMTERQLKQFVTPAIKRMLRKSQCIPHLIQPEEVAEIALFLASDSSRAMTGQEFLVDRGWAHS